MLKTLILCLALVALNITPLHAQMTGQWSVIPYANTQSFGTGQKKLMSAANSTDIAAITDATQPRFQHEVRISHDSGATWKTLFSGTVGGNRWAAISHPTPSTFLVVGDSDQYLGSFGFNDAFKYFGQFFFSGDAGKTWKRHLLDSNTIVYDGIMRNDTDGAMVVGYIYNVYDSAANQPQDSLLVTQDGWKTWTAHALAPGGKGSRELETLGPHQYLVCTYAPQNVLVTQDDGITWSRRATIPDYGIARIAVVTPQHLIAVGGMYATEGTHSRMYESFDQGTTWRLRLDSAVGDISGLMTISFSDERHGVAIGHAIYRTNDGGQTWLTDDPPVELGLYPFPARDVYMASPNFALAVMTQDIAMRYLGRSTLIAPRFHDHEPGPLPLGPTRIAWTPVIGATAYRLQITGRDLSNNTYDSTLFRTPIFDTLLNDTSVLFDAELPNFAYYVRVEAINASLHSTWGLKAALFFTVSSRDKPLPPDIVYPEQGTHVLDSVTLRWKRVNRARSYEVIVRLEHVVPIVDTVVPDTFVTVRHLPAPDAYTVQIRSILPDDQSDWSNGDFIFYTDALSVASETNSITEVYPVPASTVLHVSLDADRDVYLIDLLGNRVAETMAHSGEAVFDVRSLPAGSYLMMDSDHHQVRRVTVVH